MVNSSLLEFFPDPFLINVLDVGAALLEKPPYQGLIDAKRCRVIGFEPNPEECQRLNQVFGAPHRFFPYYIGDGKPATFYETSWAPTCSLFEPNTPLLEFFPGVEQAVRPVAQHAVETARLDDFDSIQDAACRRRNEFIEKTLRDVKPDFSALSRLPMRGVIVTCRSDSADFDLVLRFFAPAAGVHEDPVTGSAHCALGPYWQAKLGKSDFTAFQASSRGGVVKLSVRGDRVLLRGQSILMSQITLSDRAAMF